MAGFARGGGGDGRSAYGSNPYASGGGAGFRGAAAAAGGAGGAPPPAGYGGYGSTAGAAAYGSGGAGGAGSGAGYRSAGAGVGQGVSSPRSAATSLSSARKPAPSYDNEKQGAGGGAGAPAFRSDPPAGGRQGGYLVVKCPDQYVLSNCVVVNAQEWGGTRYILVEGRFAFTAVADQMGLIQPGQIGTAALQRQWAGMSVPGHYVQATSFDPQADGSGVYMAGLDVEIAPLRRGMESGEVYDVDEMTRNFMRAFDGHIFTTGQLLVFEYHGNTLRATVHGVSTMEGDGRGQRGILIGQTQVNIFKAPDSAIKLKASGRRAPTNAILQPNFKFEDMGIGGLDTEFSAIFRRAFASRIFPPALVEKLGIQHVKGILLFGPPGTGKTLMARQIGKMLNAREPKIVNGPEILNKFVGASEENVRKLFADAEKEYKDKGDESGLHIIIFDELDAICKQRGSTGGGTGVGDSVVNQLLSKMDGVDQLNNILLIGMTNRLDMIDEALLRPGRLEVHMEINLPDEPGRRQIISIQTNKMRTNGVMDDDVDLDELASLTKNFSGAEIAGLVKSATSFAFNRHVKVGTMAGIDDNVENMRVNRDDFMHALDEVQPAFGVSEEELQQVVSNGIMHFSPHVDVILNDGSLRVEQVRTSGRTRLLTALLHGPPGSGKTALAATIAINSGFPFIKLVSPENMVGMNEPQKIAYLNKVFNDSYKSPLSIIVVDNIERIVEWVPIGPRFSNGVLQALSVLLNKRPPKERRLLILATTSNKPMLTDMEVSDSFLADIRVPSITSLQSIDHVLRQTQLFHREEDHARCMGLLQSAGLGDEDGRLNIGIKKLLSEIEMARLDDDPADKLTAALTVF